MRNILLLEPDYKNKYPPLGLMKIAQYHRQQKPKARVIFAKGTADPSLKGTAWDRVYITTLFSFEWKRTEKCIDDAIALVNGKTRKVFVGGISASLMTEEFERQDKWRGVRFIKGILQDAPAISLQLNLRDFGHKDTTGKPIDEMVPDYSILEQTDFEYAVRDAYFGYASRGCIRKCAFCGVPKLEGYQRDMPPLSNLVNRVDELHGPKKDLILMDNNITAAPKFNEIIAEIRDLGFQRGASIIRSGSKQRRRVDFNQGVDSRVLARNPNLMKQLATVCVNPLRIAFDHLGVRKPYERSIRQAADEGIFSLSNYMLYNFHDTPQDLYQRLILNIELNDALGIRIWSFPMRYQPVTYKDRSFVGKNWNKYYLRSFQLILQATRGIVSGNPIFFSHAFGASEEKFIKLLMMPHEFIFNREYYFNGLGQEVLREYRAAMGKLTPRQREELLDYLCGDDTHAGIRPSIYIQRVKDTTISPAIRNVMRFYSAYGQGRGILEADISRHRYIHAPIPEGIKIEDAGLYENSPSLSS